MEGVDRGWVEGLSYDYSITSNPEIAFFWVWLGGDSVWSPACS